MVSAIPLHPELCDSWHARGDLYIFTTALIKIQDFVDVIPWRLEVTDVSKDRLNILLEGQEVQAPFFDCWTLKKKALRFFR